VAKVCLVRGAEGVSLRALSSTVPTLPLGLAYLAATTREAGHRVQLIDAVGEGADRIVQKGPIHWLGLENQQIVRRIQPDVDLIGIGNMFAHNWPMVRELIREVRAAYPNVPILVGGENATSVPELVLRDSPADLCVLGEGEETLLELIATFGNGTALEAVQGIAYRSTDGSIRRTPRRQRIRAVDDLPWPAWDLFNIDAYAERNLTAGLQVGSSPATIPVLATRGCPYQCTFCTSPNMWTTLYITRDPKRVVDEIQHYVDVYGARNFPFQDLTAIIKKEWIKDFCLEIIDRKLDILWQLPTGTRSEAVDDTVARLLKQSGMVHMAYAPESGSTRIRKAVKKRVKDQSFYESVRAATRAKLHVQCFFIMGFPEEEVADLRATLRMLARLAWMGVEDVAVSHYMPYPGSEMYERLLAQKAVDQSDRWLFAPIHTHGMWIGPEYQVNRNFSAVTQSLYALAGFALFYTVSAFRKPLYFIKMLHGLVFGSQDDLSRLQRALKGFLRTKPRFAAVKATGAPPV
jgi:anaerobic magnesium-protoporphyrin IX monomethyl ester cyclase